MKRILILAIGLWIASPSFALENKKDGLEQRPGDGEQFQAETHAPQASQHEDNKSQKRGATESRHLWASERGISK